MSQTQCAWCAPTLDPAASHGVCATCAGEVEARTWQPRWQRDISEAGGRAELAGKPDEQRAAWAAAQNLSRSRASSFLPLPPAPVTYRDPDVWYRRVGVAMCVAVALMTAVLIGQIVRWVL